MSTASIRQLFPRSINMISENKHYIYETLHWDTFNSFEYIKKSLRNVDINFQIIKMENYLVYLKIS